MAETHDTIDGLLAEFRGYAAFMPPSHHATMSWADFRKMLDRFEAAHRREKAEWVDANAGLAKLVDIEKVGDLAKLRDALKSFVEYSDLVCRMGIFTRDGLIATTTKARAALTAPPRNCDRFATVDEARKAHEAICEKYGKCHHGCPLNNEEHYSAFDCFEAWLFAPATEKK